MRWEAANLPTSQSDDRQGRSVGSNDTQIACPQEQQRQQQQQHSGETVEAALSRLTKAYSTAMACVGALNKLHQAASYRKEIPEHEVQNLREQAQNVAKAARKTFEESILLDPLIRKNAPTWWEAIRDVASSRTDQDDDEWSFVLNQFPEPPRLTSVSHRNSVLEIGYLALLNYADLLVSCQRYSESLLARHDNVLDNGVVKALPMVGWPASRIQAWDQRLAVTSLCDAVELDGSDPVVWLKLACAARRLSRLVTLDGFPLEYRRLERHALEEGSLVLSPNLPPNRLIIRALKELEDVPEIVPTIIAPKQKPVKLELDLPRYSWSTLARMLIRAFREGTVLSNGTFFGSPMIVMKISPMLVLPPKPLGAVCEYLDNRDIWRFEATCRALSVSIISARVALEQSRIPPRPAVMTSEAKKGPTEEEMNDVSIPLKSEGKKDNAGLETRTKKVESARSSKRVRSQLITSGKKAERQSNRSSVSYCLLASVLGCTSESSTYLSLITKPIDWDSGEFEAQNKIENQLIRRSSTIQKMQGPRERGAERLGDACLTAFAQRWSVNSGPVEVLERFITHIAVHVDCCFSDDSGETVVLASFFLEIIELLEQLKGMKNTLANGWFGPTLDKLHREDNCLTAFAVNLLYAELLLRRCDGQAFFADDFDGDCNLVSMLIYELLDGIVTIEELFGNLLSNRTWLSLKARCHWFAAGYFLWRRKSSSEVYEAAQAEESVLDQIESLLRLLNANKSIISEVQTPHLASPRRSEPFWKSITLEALVKFRNEIQSEAVVSSSRQSFLESIEYLSSPNQESKEGALRRLEIISETLLDRYKCRSDPKENRHGELVEDFLGVSGSLLFDELNASGRVDVTTLPSRWNQVWRYIPDSGTCLSGLSDMSKPSILSILFGSYVARNDMRVELILILVRSIIASMRIQEIQLNSSNVSKSSSNAADSDFSDSEDDIMSSDDETELTNGNPIPTKELNKFLMTELLILFLMDKMWYIIANLPERLKREIRDHALFVSSVGQIMNYVANWHRMTIHTKQFQSLPSLDLDLFLRTSAMISNCCKGQAGRDLSELEKRFFVGMTEVVCAQRHNLPSFLQPSKGKGTGQRALRQRLCLSRAKLISSVASVWSLMLSETLLVVDDDKVKHSQLIRVLMEERQLSSKLAFLVESLLFLWTIAVKEDTGSTTFLERITSDEIKASVSCMIISLAGSTLSQTEKGEERLSLYDFYDSDASSNEETCEDSSHLSTDSRRALCQAIQCISIVFSSMDEKSIMSFTPNPVVIDTKEKFLPLITVRVLTHLSDLLLREFGSGSRRDNVWSAHYPFGLRSIGAVLDKTLHKAYKHIYGFSLSLTKDSSHEDSTKTKLIPESAKAASQLYRCIRRTYTDSRRSPPHSSLVCAVSALPPPPETYQSKLLKEFLFIPKKDLFTLRDVRRAVTNESGWEGIFDSINLNVLMNSKSESTSEMTDEDFNIAKARTGLSRDLAEGPLPASTKSDDSKGEVEDRLSTSRFEKALSRKFNALFEDLCLGSISNPKVWLTTAQCLHLKAEVIADRCGLSKGFARGGPFAIPNKRVMFPSLLRLAELKEVQESEFLSRRNGWTAHIGSDLSLYVNTQWSSFEALKDLATAVVVGEDEQDREVLLELYDSYDRKDFATLQCSWSGIFIEALRTIALRCLLMARFLLLKNEGEDSRDVGGLQSEVLEAIGLFHYTKLVGNQVYGYPMYTMTAHQKRQLAEISSLCFEEAIEKVSNSREKDDESNFTWDLEFMVGKCKEKIATTFWSEAFAPLDGKLQSHPRLYERSMSEAIARYGKALEDAKIEEAAGMTDIQEGGSSHGSTEAVYRLHATRLKCLLRAVQMDEEVRSAAELEALRLTESHWFMKPENMESTTDIRSRVWAILSDVVEAFVHCRSQHAFFHRSVYRHAQCLMWAPVFDNPTAGYGPGSLGVVPATKSVKIRGLTSSTSCANSAEAVIASLFDRKRIQLVGVWVTTVSSVSSPFEQLNNSVRKYDSLRGKYLSGYVECLETCRRTNQLETVQQWIVGAKRDLPSFYAASALNYGRQPESHHNRDSLLKKSRNSASMGLLTTAKRQINDALARVVMKDFLSAGKRDNNNSDFLKRAYACFLRTNCSLAELENTRGWKFGRTLPAVDTLYHVYEARPDRKQKLKDVMDWSGGGEEKADLVEAALEKCRELFPNMATTIYRVRKPSSKKKSGSAKGDTGAQKQSKRSNPLSGGERTLKQFVVKVPTGLSVGAKFEVSLAVGNETKTIRLTVPAGNPDKLKFTLPGVTRETDEGEKQEQKRIKLGESSDLD